MRKKVLIGLSTFVLTMAILVASDNLSPVLASPCAPESSNIEDGDTVYTILEFKTPDETQTFTCTWTSPATAVAANVLIIGGGGGGGSATSFSNAGAGGGGAGRFVEFSLQLLPANSYQVIVGRGGPAGGTGNNSGSNGYETSVFGQTAPGGGFGAGGNVSGNSGGSGGGSRGTHGGGNIAGSPEPGFGNSGGGGSSNVGDSAGGGGGAGESGAPISPTTGSAGGAGLQSAITGTSKFYAAGGAGGAAQSNSIALGGSGIGGDGANDGTPATSGARSTGSGGGGGNNNRVGASGGSGIAIIRYIAPPTISETNGIVISVDPRSESVSIPYLSATSSAPSRICIDLVSNANSSLALKSFVNKNTNSNAFRMAVTFDDVSVEVGAENSLNKITASRTNAPSLLKRNAPNNESYLRLYRPSDGWSNVNGGKLKIGIDYLGSDCSSGSFPAMNIEIPIKVLDLVSVQKNPIDLSRN